MQFSKERKLQRMLESDTKPLKSGKQFVFNWWKQYDAEKNKSTERTRNFDDNW